MIGQERSSLVRSTALLAIAALIPILLFAAVSAASSLQRERADLNSQLIGDARHISEAIDGELGAALEAAQDLAQQPYLDGAGDPVAFAEVARRQQAATRFG